MRISKTSTGYTDYLKSLKKEKIKILICQVALLVGFVILWEVLANQGIISTFLFSKPSAIYKLFIQYVESGQC